MRSLGLVVTLMAAVGASAAVVAAVPKDGSVVIERPDSSERNVPGIFKREPAPVPDILNEDKTVTESPAGTTTVYVTDSPVPEPVEDVAAIATTHTGVTNPPYDLVLKDGSVEEAVIVTTTAIVEATVVTTVTAVGSSGGSSFTIMSGLQPTITTSATDTSAGPDPVATSTSWVTSTNTELTTSTNLASKWSSELTAVTATKSKTPAMITVTSKTTRDLPSASSTVHPGSNSASEVKGGCLGLTMLVEMILSFMLVLML